MKQWICLCIVLVAVLSHAAADVLTLEEAIESAAANNTDLAIAEVNLETALRNNGLVSSYIPEISLDGSVSLDDMSIIGKDGGTFGGTLSLGVSMELGTELITDGRLKTLEKENARLEYQQTAEELKQSVITAYWNIALSQQNVESAAMAEADSLEALKSIEEQYANGEADETEILEARLEALQYNYEKMEYENQLSLAYTAFSKLTGIQDVSFETEEIQDIPKLSLPSAAELMKEYASSSISIRLMQNEIDIAEAETMASRMTNQIPSITLSAEYVIGAEQNISRWADLQNDRGSVSVGFSIPISSYIPGSSGYLDVKEKEDAEKIASISLKAAEDDLYSSIEENLSIITQAENAKSIAEEQLEATKRAYELKTIRYENGYITYDELSDARRELLSAELSLTESRINQLLGLYGLSMDIGIDVSEIISTYATEETE